MKSNKIPTMGFSEKLDREDLIACIEKGISITSPGGSDTLFRMIHDAVLDTIPARCCAVYLYDANKSRFNRMISSDRETGSYRDIQIRASRGIIGHVAKTRTMIQVDDISDCRFYNSEIDSPDGTDPRTVICLPVILNEALLGAIAVYDHDGVGEKQAAMLAAIADFSAVAIQNDMQLNQLKNLSLIDGLTGLYNTRYLYSALEELAEQSRSRGDHFSVIFMDLDNFKFIVDTCGHLNGSQAIHEVAQTIMDELKKPEFAVSYGGDEFVIILPECRKKEALRRAVKIRHRMARTVYLANRGLSVTLSASFGVAAFPEDSSDTRNILDLADKALFYMKKSGKDGVRGIFEVFDEDDRNSMLL